MLRTNLILNPLLLCVTLLGQQSLHAAPTQRAESNGINAEFESSFRKACRALPAREETWRVSIGEIGHGPERQVTPFSSVLIARLSAVIQRCPELEEYSRKEMNQVHGELKRSLSDLYSAAEGAPEAGLLSLVHAFFTANYQLEGESLSFSVSLIEVESSRVLFTFESKLTLTDAERSLVQPPMLTQIGDVLENLGAGVGSVQAALGDLAPDSATVDRVLDGVPEDWTPKIQAGVSEGLEVAGSWLQTLLQWLAIGVATLCLAVIWLIGSGRLARILSWIND
ncbi:MAG: hypothetical protein ACI835_003193 [Planctomycetota bacterium]|jgi:hypothetical protein